MTKLITKWFQVVLLSIGLLASMGSHAEDSAAAADQAQDADQELIETRRPGYGAVLGDALVARPIGLVATVVGAVVWVVTSPLTLVTGTIGEAGQSLVIDPALTTFYRCLGCTESGWRNLPPADAD